jgi:hypothetical protein
MLQSLSRTIKDEMDTAKASSGLLLRPSVSALRHVGTRMCIKRELWVLSLGDTA